MKQENPLTIRLWREVDAKVMEQANEMYGGNVNATFNLLLMRGLGFQDFHIEQECAKNLRKRGNNAGE